MKMTRQHAAPLLIENLAGEFTPKPLTRLPQRQRPGECGFPERLLQELVNAYPETLPVKEFEPAFSYLRPVCTELPLGGQYLDNLLINADGRICLVECKLWRNPEAVRKVVGQVLDYAGELSQLTYEDLDSAVRRACRQKSGNVLAEKVLGPEATDADRADFHDAVSRSLQLGNFLLLIVGDGIRLGLEQIAELLERRAALGFSLALIEMAVYSSETNGGPYYVQPRLLLKTKVITRTVFVAGRDAEAAQVANVSAGTKPQTLSEQEFFAKLAEQDRTYPEAVQTFLERCEAAGVEPELLRKFVLYVELADGDSINVGTISKDGSVATFGVASRDGKIGQPVGRRYLERVAAFLGPDATVKTSTPGNEYVSYGGKASIPLKVMLDNQQKWLSAISEAVNAFRSHGMM